MSKQGETLEQMAQQFLDAQITPPPERPTIEQLEAILNSEQVEVPLDILPDGSIAVRAKEENVKSHAAFARKVLEEAKGYMRHDEGCASYVYCPEHCQNEKTDEPCSCGLAELLEGWK